MIHNVRKNLIIYNRSLHCGKIYRIFLIGLGGGGGGEYNHTHIISSQNTSQPKSQLHPSEKIIIFEELKL